MEIKSILGDKFKENMTVDELLKLDVDFVPKSSLDGLVEKNVLDKATKEANEWKQKYRETLDDATRLREENEEKQAQMEKELTEFKREKSISDLTSNYVSLGYSTELAKSSAIAQIDNDNDTLFKNMQSFQDAKMQELTDYKQKSTPSPTVSNSRREHDIKFENMSSYDLIAYQQQAAEATE